jgi:ribosome-binding protein aMBF1 (putative translation factor)
MTETRIKQARQKQGLSIAGLSYRIAIHPTTISMIERRKLAASQRARGAVCDFLGLDESKAFDSNGLAV